jgi:hypothetical protein
MACARITAIFSALPGFLIRTYFDLYPIRDTVLPEGKTMIKNTLTASLIALALGSLTACTTTATSNPPRTATEQMLISTAAERAASRLSLDIPTTAKIFVESANFEGTDSKYAVSAIRARLLHKGLTLVDDKKAADVILEIRSGALSTDHKTYLVGIPAFPIPIPLTSTPLTFPEIAFYSSDAQKGVAKFADSSYSVKQGTLVSEDDPQYGFSHTTKKSALFFFSWIDTDTLPAYAANEDDSELTAALQNPQPTSGSPEQP